MLDGECGRRVGVTGLDQRDELVVLVGGDAALLGEGAVARIVERHADAGMVDQQPAEAGGEIVVVGHLADEGVETLVQQRPFGDIAIADGGAEQELGVLEAHDLGRGRVFGGEAGDRGVDHRGGDEDAQGLVGHGRDLRAAVLVQQEVALPGQLAERLAQRGAGDLVGRGEFHLVQIAARGQILGQDSAAKILQTKGFPACGPISHDTAPCGWAAAVLPRPPPSNAPRLCSL